MTWAERSTAFASKGEGEGSKGGEGRGREGGRGRGREREREVEREREREGGGEREGEEGEEGMSKGMCTLEEVHVQVHVPGTTHLGLPQQFS